MTERATLPSSVPLSELVDGWVADGIINAEQAALIRGRGPVLVQHEPVPSPDRNRLATEALGYLGGVIIVVSSFLIANLYWDDLGTATRLVVLGAAAAALFGAGYAVPTRLRDAGSRLRSVLWLGATAAVAGFLGLFGWELLGLADADLAVFVAAGTAASAALLWRAHRVLPQQVAVMVALMVTAAAVIADLDTPDSLAGVGVWAVAATWLILGWADLLGPRGPVLALSAAAAILGAMLTMSDDGGIALAIATAVAVVTVAVLLRDLVLLAVGSVGSLVVLPRAVTEWFPDTTAVPFALLALGILLVGIAVWTARRRGRHPDRRGPDVLTLTPMVALSVVVIIWLGVAATVVTTGLS